MLFGSLRITDFTRIFNFLIVLNRKFGVNWQPYKFPVIGSRHFYRELHPIIALGARRNVLFVMIRNNIGKNCTQLDFSEGSSSF